MAAPNFLTITMRELVLATSTDDACIQVSSCNKISILWSIPQFVFVLSSLTVITDCGEVILLTVGNSFQYSLQTKVQYSAYRWITNGNKKQLLGLYRESNVSHYAKPVNLYLFSARYKTSLVAIGSWVRLINVPY
jgi:hypothetical protein